jgi:hypothetical protein
MEAICIKGIVAVMTREVGQDMNRDGGGRWVRGRKGREIKKRGVKLTGRRRKEERKGG